MFTWTIGTVLFFGILCCSRLRGDNLDKYKRKVEPKDAQNYNDEKPIPLPSWAEADSVDSFESAGDYSKKKRKRSKRSSRGSHSDSDDDLPRVSRKNSNRSAGGSSRGGSSAGGSRGGKKTKKSRK